MIDNLISKFESLDRIKNYIDLWPIVTFLTLILGYIGFYTYSAFNNLSFINPNIILIAGIGIYNLIAFLLLYNPIKRNKNPSLIRACLITGYLNFLIINPIILVSLIILDIQFIVMSKEIINKKKSYYRLRKLVQNKIRNEIILNAFLIISIILGFLFLNKLILLTIVGVYFFSKVFYHLKKDIKKNFFKILIISFCIPILTSKNHFENINYTIFGLSKEYSEVTTENKSYKGLITYKSEKEVYLKIDSLNLLIPFKEVKSIRVIDTLIKPETGIEYIKKEYNNYIN